MVFFKAVMDNALGKYLNAGLPDTSGKYNDREARNEGKITGFLDEVQGQTAYQSFKQKMIKNRVRLFTLFTCESVEPSLCVCRPTSCCTAHLGISLLYARLLPNMPLKFSFVL